MLIYSCMSLFLESNKVGESSAAAHHRVGLKPF